jgi:hypothetical protein
MAHWLTGGCLVHTLYTAYIPLYTTLYTAYIYRVYKRLDTHRWTTRNLLLGLAGFLWSLIGLLLVSLERPKRSSSLGLLWVSLMTRPKKYQRNQDETQTRPLRPERSQKRRLIRDQQKETYYLRLVMSDERARPRTTVSGVQSLIHTLIHTLIHR